MNTSNYSFLPLKISVFVVAGLNNADDGWSRYCNAMPAIASASLLIVLLESEFCLCRVCSTIDNVLLGEMCVAKFCG